MASDTVVDTHRGTLHKYDIVRQSGGTFSSSKFYILRDGKRFKGPYSSLREAHDAAVEEG